MGEVKNRESSGYTVEVEGDFLSGLAKKGIAPPRPRHINRSGIDPLDLRVLVKPDDAEKVTAGGIIIPETLADQKKMAMTKGTLVATGVNAWEEAASRSTSFVKPVPGDRVLIAKYGGVVVTGLDGEDYRLMNDEDVIGRLEE